MENKQKAIEKAYGEHWEAVKDYVDENGWVYTQTKHFNNISGLSHSNLQTTIFNSEMEYYWRPKSLQGIETNNGWIKIESESDLPSEKIKVWFFTFGEEKIGTFHPLLKEFRTESNIYNYGSVTHYQPIIKPKPPIY